MHPLYLPLAVGFFILSLCFGGCQLMGYFVFQETSLGWLPCLFIGLTLTYICICSSQKNQVLRRDLFLTTCLLWFTTALLGTLPYLLVGHYDGITGLFESISGLTTTGATNIQAIEAMPKSLLLWRALSQWIGGLGFVVFFISFLGQSNRYDKQLLAHEETALGRSMSLYHFRTYILSVFRIYMGLTLCCILSLIYFKMPWFDAVCHALATVSTGGFSTYNTGLLDIQDLHIQMIFLIFMFLGGINFLFLIQIFTASGPNLTYHHEFRVYCIWIFICISVFLYFLMHSAALPLFEALRHALFQVVSISSTTGFASCDFTTWPNTLFVWAFLLMFIGGCSGSTAGGVKIFRAIALLRMFGNQFEKVFRPEIVRSLRLDGQVWQQHQQMNLMHFFILFCTIVVLGSGLLQCLEPQLGVLSTFSSVLACLTNVGVGLMPEVGPLGNYCNFSPLAKLLLGFFMLLGRLELYAILILFLPKFWKKFD